MANPFKKTPPMIDPAKEGRPAGAFWRQDDQMVLALAAELQGRKVLEIFGGNGLLARKLADLGIDIVCTSRLSSMDAHESGLYHPVIEMEAQDAVIAFGAERDVLLMCWPTVTDAALRACELWGAKPIAFIGEVTDYSRGHLGGCATDEFHARARPEKKLPYRGNILEQAWIGTLAPELLPGFPAPKAKSFF